MSLSEHEGTPSTNAGTNRETRKRELEEKQKTFEKKSRKRLLQLQLEYQVDAVALESELLQYQEEDLLQRQHDYALRQQKLAESADAFADMEQKLNMERDKLAELQRTLDTHCEELKSEEQKFAAEKEAIGSLEQDIVSKRQKLEANRKKLAFTQMRSEDDYDLLTDDSSTLEMGEHKRRRSHSRSAFDTEILLGKDNSVLMTPSSSNIRSVHTNAGETKPFHSHLSSKYPHDRSLGSPKDEAHGAVLRQIRAKEGDHEDNPLGSVLGTNKAIVGSVMVIEEHRLAVLEKATKLNKPVKDASDIPADPRTTIPDKLKDSARLKSFNELTIVRKIDQYVGDVHWFGEERPLAALLAYMTGEIKEPCTNCKKAADLGNKYWTQFLMCVTSDKLINGECCHCHFRTTGTPCSHRTAGAALPTKRSSLSMLKETRDDEESSNGVLSERKSKIDAILKMRRASVQMLLPHDEDEVEQLDLTSWC